MASDDSSSLSDLPSTTSNPFTIQARSIASSHVPAKNTRNFATRAPVIYGLSQVTQQQPTPAPQGTNENEEEQEEEQEEEILEIRLRSQAYSCRPQALVQAFRNRLIVPKTPETSWIHEHARSLKRSDGSYWQCIYCSRLYKISGGSHAFSRHLKQLHNIDPLANSVAQKRDQNGTNVHSAILRQADMQRELLKDDVKQSLNKTTLEYLYIRWITTHNHAFNQVTHGEFRDCLEYVSPTANRLLPNASSTIRLHAMALMLATAISDIHVTCDMWTSPNHLAILAVVAHLTNKKLQLVTVTLAMIEIQGEHLGLNQAMVVEQVIDDFGFRNKLGYFVMDNASSNNQLLQTITRSMNRLGIPYDPEQRRLRCNGHVVQAFLFGREEGDYEGFNESESPSEEQIDEWRKFGPLSRLHNIVI